MVNGIKCNKGIGYHEHLKCSKLLGKEIARENGTVSGLDQLDVSH